MSNTQYHIWGLTGAALAAVAIFHKDARLKALKAETEAASAAEAATQEAAEAEAKQHATAKATMRAAQVKLSPAWGLLDKFCDEPSAAQPLQERPKICQTALDAIGHTPLIKLNKIPLGNGTRPPVECEILAKCEFFNAGGSVKDRIGKRMVLDAQAKGLIAPGATKLIEPTSGNTGIGIALAGAVLGYEVIITLPEKMSNEKVNVLKALGATIHRTPTEAAYDSPESHISLANRLRDAYCAESPGSKIPAAYILDQYANPSNPLAHYDGTAEEIIRQCDGKVDMVVMGAGTGGTMTGIARKLKEKIPGVVIVGVDPDGSLLAKGEQGGEEIKSYQVEGIGYDFVPEVCDRGIVDDWVKSKDQESFDLARELIRHEGLLCGGSCGSAMAGALKAVRGDTMLKKVKALTKGQRCIVVLPDSTRNYMTKFLTDDWMISNKFMKPKAVDSDAHPYSVGELIDKMKLKKPVTCSLSTPISDALTLMTKGGFSQLPVVDDHKRAVGYISAKQCIQKVQKRDTTKHGRVITVADPVDDVCVHFSTSGTGNGARKFQAITRATMVDSLDRFFEHNFCAFVETDEGGHRGEVEAIITPIDILQYKFKFH